MLSKRDRITSTSDNELAGLTVLLTPEGQKRLSRQCTMIGIELGTVLLECEEPVDAPVDVTLSFDRITLKGSVRYCNSKNGRFRISVTVAEESHEQRSSPRFPMDEAGTLIALYDGGTIALPCRLTDFSRSGLGVQSASVVENGTMICIETSSMMVVGSVRRCTAGETGNYKLGIAVTDVLCDHVPAAASPWSVAGLRLRLAEIILGRTIGSIGVSTSVFRR